MGPELLFVFFVFAVATVATISALGLWTAIFTYFSYTAAFVLSLITMAILLKTLKERGLPKPKFPTLNPNSSKKFDEFQLARLILRIGREPHDVEAEMDSLGVKYEYDIENFGSYIARASFWLTVNWRLLQSLILLVPGASSISSLVERWTGVK